MRKLILVALLPTILAACGSTERKTVVVNAPPGSTVVVPSDDGKTTVVR
jgi:hypothetical protein